MNDEGTTDYNAIIDQMTEGLYVRCSLQYSNLQNLTSLI